MLENAIQPFMLIVPFILLNLDSNWILALQHCFILFMIGLSLYSVFFLYLKAYLFDFVCQSFDPREFPCLCQRWLYLLLNELPSLSLSRWSYYYESHSEINLHVIKEGQVKVRILECSISKPFPKANIYNKKLRIHIHINRYNL